MIDACDQYIGKWGETEPWRHCERPGCGQPKAQHELPPCPSQAIVRGVLYQCELRTPHTGLRCQSEDAEWGMPHA